MAFTSSQSSIQAMTMERRMDSQMVPPNGTWNGWPFDFSQFPHDNYGPQVNYAIWALTAAAATFLGLRVYCKFLRRRGLWWDDYILIASWVALAVQTVLISYNTTIGYGKHIWDFNPKDLTTFLLLSNTSGFFSILAATWSKTSFAITVLRISDGWIKKFIWFIMISVNLALGFAAVSTYIQCSPAEKLWRPMMEGKCWPKEVLIRYQVFTAAYSGAMDIILAILPWKIIWALTMNKKEKVGVMLAMSMGVFAGVVSIVKITQLPAINKFDLIDGIWLSILGTAEGAITIVAASIPILRALINQPPVREPPIRIHIGEVNMYAGGLDTTGTNSTVITSTRNSMSQARSSRSSYLFSYSKYKRDSDGWFGKMIESNDAPPAKILQTQEVSVKWESNEDIGKAM